MSIEAAGDRCPTALLERPHWYALRTRARHEKQTHRFIQGLGVEAVAAVAEVERRWADRTRTVGMPLFPGYIFVRIPLSQTEEVLRWPGAVDLVRTGRYPSPVRDGEMAAVLRLARGVSRTNELPEPVDFLAPGVRVLVEEGPFEGMEGMLLNRRGQSRVAVRLDALRQARAVEIPRRWLVRVGG